MYDGKAASLMTDLQKMEHEAEAALALKKKATVEFLAQLNGDLKPRVDALLVDVSSFSKIVCPPAPKAKAKGQAKGKGKAKGKARPEESTPTKA